MKPSIVRLFVISAVGFSVAACQATVGVAAVTSVPKDSAPRCEAICNGIGLALSSVVVMADNVGCVCEARAALPAPSKAAVSGGVAAVLMEEAAQRQARQQQQQQQH